MELAFGVNGEGFDILALSMPCGAARLEETFDPRLEGGTTGDGWTAYRPLLRLSLLFFLVGVSVMAEASFELRARGVD